MKTQIKILLILFFFTAVGVCSGAFYEIYMQQSDKKFLGEILFRLLEPTSIDNEVNAGITFGNSVCASLKSFLPIIIAGFCSPIVILFLPILPAYSAFKGFTIGVFSTLLIENFGMKGILFIIKALLIPTVLQIVVICYLGAISLILGKKFIVLMIIKRKNNTPHRKKLFKSDIKQYMFSYAVGTVIIIISFIFQAFLLSTGL